MAFFFLVFILCAIFVFWAGKTKARERSSPINSIQRLHSLPIHYGILTTLAFSLPILFIVALWFLFAPFSLMWCLAHSPFVDKIAGIHNESLQYEVIATTTQYQHIFFYSTISLCYCTLLFGCYCAYRVWKRITPELHAKYIVERFIYMLLLLCASAAVLVSLTVIVSLLVGTGHFFQIVSITDFVFGLQWSPQIAIRPDQIATNGQFGSVPVLLNTFLVAAIAMAIATPPGLLIAIYLAEYASSRCRIIMKPVLEIFSGIPTIVYGFIAAFLVAPLLARVGNILGIKVDMENALAAGIVIGIMILPYISSLAEDAIHTVPQNLRNSSLQLGATQYETIRHIVIPAALPGIVGAIFLAFSRAVGETMIAFMAVGLTAHFTLNPLHSVTTVAVQIVTLLVGDSNFHSPKALVVFALGLLLCIITMLLNILAMHVAKKYQHNISQSS